MGLCFDFVEDLRVFFVIDRGGLEISDNDLEGSFDGSRFGGGCC